MMLGRVLGSSLMAAASVAALPAPARIKRASPCLDPRTQVDLIRPRAALVAVQKPIILGDGVGIEDAVALLQRIALGEIVADEGGIDGAVDDGVRDMDAGRPERARQ